MSFSLTDRQTICTNHAPASLGPYSQGIRMGNFLFLSGQLGMKPASSDLVSGGVAEQTEQAILNVKAVLESQQLGLSSVVKSTIFLANMEDFAAMNDVYSKYFKDILPARSTVEVSRLPKDALVEIEVIAIAAA